MEKKYFFKKNKLLILFTYSISTIFLGFWDEPTSVKKTKPSKQQQSAPAANKQASSKPTNSRSKKEEETLKKIFNQGQESQDEFTVWCTTVLSGLNSSLDSKLNVYSPILNFLRKMYKILKNRSLLIFNFNCYIIKWQNLVFWNLAVS